MGLTKQPVMQGFIRLCEDGYHMGWHERNGGNLTYRMTMDEVSEASPYFAAGPWVPMDITVKNLASSYFISTGSGKFMRNVPISPADQLCIAELNETGTAYRIVWGLEHGGVPTSEFPSHLLNHSAKMDALQGAHRVIYHAHTPNLIALTFLLPLDAKTFSRVLWKSMTECPIIFPAGVGVLPWMIPGGTEIAYASSRLMKTYDILIWAHHGSFCSAPDFDNAFGLMHTAEKSAEIYLKVLSSGGEIRQTIRDEELLSVADAFGVPLNRSFLEVQ